MSDSKDCSIKDVEKVLQGIDGEIKKVHVDRLTAPGENNVSLVFKVDFEVEKDGNFRTLSTVAKRVPPHEKKDNQPNFATFPMKNEIIWYREIVPLMQEFGNEFQIDIDYYPEFLGARYSLDPSKEEVDEESVLLLENLILQGYKNEDRYVGFDLESAKSILNALAKFHAVPLAMKFKKPEQFKILMEYLRTTRPEGPPPPPPAQKDGSEKPSAYHRLIDVLLNLPRCEPYRSGIAELANKPYHPMVLTSTEEPWCTVAHDDFWVNNVMIKPRECGSPLVKMVDYQFCSYSSYAKDVLFFLLTSLRNDVQIEHIDELMRYYYEQLTSILAKQQIPELELSYEQYLEELKNVAKVSEVAHVVFFSLIVFGPKISGSDTTIGEMNMFERMDYMLRNVSDVHSKKLALIIETCAQRGWL